MIPDLNQEPLTQQPQNLILLLETPNQSQPSVNVRPGSDKYDPTRLIADALETELVHSNDPCHNSGPGDFFDCNACLRPAADPVLTCCGHLFCWPCFHFLPYEDSNSAADNNVKECPVCGGDVADSDLVPIYGNSDKSHCPGDKKRKTPAGSEIPPRPTAKRVQTKTVAAPALTTFLTARIERQIRELTGLAARVAAQRSGNENFDAGYFSRLVLQGNAVFGLEEESISDWSSPQYNYLFDHVNRRT